MARVWWSKRLNAKLIIYRLSYFKMDFMFTMGSSSNKLPNFTWRKRKVSWKSQHSLSRTICCITLIANYGHWKPTMSTHIWSRVIMVLMQRGDPAHKGIFAIRKSLGPSHDLVFTPETRWTKPIISNLLPEIFIMKPIMTFKIFYRRYFNFHKHSRC